MRRILCLLSMVLFLASCKNEIKINPTFNGHWINEDFYNDIKSKKDIQTFGNEKLELVLSLYDTSFTLIDYNESSTEGKLELFKNEHLVIKNYFRTNKNADIILNNSKLELINPNTSEKTVFIKIDSTEFEKNEILAYSTFGIPYINKNYISGKYTFNTDTVEFFNSGRVLNLDGFTRFSLCINSNCRNNNNFNTIFLSGKNNEGNYYEYQLKNDSLTIFEIDKRAFDRGLSAGNIGVKYQLKKIN